MKYNEMPKPNKKLSPLRSIKFYCKHSCCAGDTISWKKCTAERCVLWRYRLGKGNKEKKINSDEKVYSIERNLKKKEALEVVL